LHIEGRGAQKPADAGANSRETKTVTVTGCLTKGPQPNTFLLTKVPDSLVDPVVVRTTGVVPTVTYQLSGGKDLVVHVGHKIEITGKAPVKPEAAVEVEHAEIHRVVPEGQKPTSTEIKEKAAIAVRPLAVESVRAIAPSCAGM
jgi:hypothetical protein